MSKMRLGERLVQEGALTPQQVETALNYQSLWRCKFGEVLLCLKMLHRGAFLRLLAKHLNVPFIRPGQMDKVPDSMLRTVPEEMIQRRRIYPLSIQKDGEQKSLYVATDDPENLACLYELAFTTGCQVHPVLAYPEDIDRSLRRRGLLPGRIAVPIDLPDAEDFRDELDHGDASWSALLPPEDRADLDG